MFTAQNLELSKTNSGIRQIPERTAKYKCPRWFWCTVMSVRSTSGSTSTRQTLYRTASYMPCDECWEGAMVWNDDRGTSECRWCGNVYTEGA
jgi:hypothetical protein